MADTKNTQPVPSDTVNSNGTINPPANQGIKLAASPKTPDEKEFGPGIWVFSKAMQRPIVTGADAGPVEDRVLLKATNVDEALAEARENDLYEDVTQANATLNFTNSDTTSDPKDTNHLEQLKVRAKELGLKDYDKLNEADLSTKIREAEEAQTAKK